jgi:hypothetical protein
MELGTVRGKIDFEADPRTVTLIVYAAPSTGGRGRARQEEFFELDAVTVGDVEDYLDIVLPDNIPA